MVTLGPSYAHRPIMFATAEDLFKTRVLLSNYNKKLRHGFIGRQDFDPSNSNLTSNCTYLKF